MTSSPARKASFLSLPIGLVFFGLFTYCAVHSFKQHRQAVAVPGGGWTAMLALPLPLWSYVMMYIGAVGTFLSFLFLFENILVLVRRQPRRLSLTDEYVNGDPPVVDRLAAFEYDTPSTSYERFKICFFLVTGILPIRLFGMAASILAAMACVAISGKFNRHTHPMWYSFWSTVGTFFGALCLAFCGVYHVKAYGEVSPQSRCKLLIGNHTCVMEGLILFVLGDWPSFVSRTENCKVWLFGDVVRACNAILVDRDAATSRKQTLDAIKARATDPRGARLMVFPEGTTGNQRTLFLFKKGVFEAGEPVQMVCTLFPYKHFNPCWTGTGVGGNSVLGILVRLCSQFVTHAETRVLPVYHPTEEERHDPVLYAAHCQKMMATVVRANVSSATLRDYAAAEAAYKSKLAERKSKVR